MRHVILLWLLAPVMAAQELQTVFRVTTELIQVDAIVIESKGRPVTDLSPDDFEVRQDGKRQKITHFAYVQTGTSPQVARTPGRGVIPLRLTPDEVRRIVVLVVDDIGLKMRNMPRVRQALDRFVDQQVQPGDLVAIAQTGRGEGVSGQQLTNDKRVLRAAIGRLTPSLSNRADIQFRPKPRGADAQELSEWRLTEDANRSREEALSVGTLDATAKIVQGLARLPGRKSIVLFTEGIPVNSQDHILPDTQTEVLPEIRSSRNRGKGDPRIIEAVQRRESTDRIGVRRALARLSVQANRAGVVVYAVDPTIASAEATGLDVTDQPDQMQRPDLLTTKARLAGSNDIENQAGLQQIAKETAGLYLRTTNLDDALRRVMADEEGYYLIGYKPPEGTLASDAAHAMLHAFEVRVKKRGLRVRARSGFAGLSDRLPATPKTPDDYLTETLLAPFAANDIGVRLTALFQYRDGPLVQSLVHLDVRDLQFSRTPDAYHVAAMDAALATFGEDDSPTGKVTRHFDIRLEEAAYQRALETGLDFNLAHKVKPGAYQWGIAVRDAASGKTGSARQFIEIPDVSSGGLALSGLLVREASGAVEDPRAGPAARCFHEDRPLVFSYEVFNGHRKAAGRMSLEAQARVFRDGVEVWTDAATTMETAEAEGRLQAAALKGPGRYVLVITVTDRAAEAKRGAAEQSIDFEIVAPDVPARTKVPRAVPATPVTPVESAAAPAPEEIVRIRMKLAEEAPRRPNYTCLETIERRQMYDGCASCESTDRLRLEVAVVGGKERFAWPGTSEFEDKEVAQLVLTGLVGTGDFAGVSDFVFFSTLTRYKPVGEEVRDGRRTVRYEYVVPAGAKGFHIQSDNLEAMVGFHGSFWVDSETGELVRLETHADDIPPALKVTSSEMAVDYGAVRIGPSDFTLPRMTELRMARQDGMESQNVTRFSSCRQFAAESTLSFDTTVSAAATTKPAEVLLLPAGLRVDSQLTAPVTITGSALGDLIEAVVTADVKHDGKLLIPKGAKLSGRIRHLSDHKRLPGSVGSSRWAARGSVDMGVSYSSLGFQLTEVAYGNTRATFHARLQMYTGLIRSAGGRMIPAETVMADQSDGEMTILGVRGRLAEIPKGFWFRWVTVL